MRKWLVLVLALALFCVPTIALANSAEPPGLIVAVSGAPDDLALSLRFDEGQVPLRVQKKAWVTYYRFHYYDMIEAGVSHEKEVEDAVLVTETGGAVKAYDLPSDAFGTYNNLLELDLKAETLVVGQNPWRVPLLVVLRVVLTLLIEGAVFALLRYREKRTWIAFFVINLLTQTGLNAAITGPQLGYWFISYVLLEILIFITESVALCLIVREKKRWQTVLCVIAANALSLVLGGVLISWLPV